MSLGLYLHIPYCFSKCRYCDFYSHPGERGVPEAYVNALLRELDRFAPEAPLQPDTLYFGGGTPSLLCPEQAKRLIDAARPMPGAEITLEANPETVTEESLAGFREAGVNRISFGVQSARDTQLRTLGRPHTAKQARAAFAAARRAGFANISGDIMLALPHYTEAEFDETLELIEGGGATHISAYLLKIEPDSAFGKHPPEGLPTGDEAADFYLYAVEQLEHPAGLKASTIGALEDFATGVRDADAMLGKLTEYFSQVDEPVILVFWGDHYNPIDSNYDVFTRSGYANDSSADPKLHQTTLLMWSNYTDKPVDLGTIAAYDISPVMMNIYGLKQPLYFQYLNRQLQVACRSNTRGTILNRDGSTTNTMTALQQKWNQNHWMLQYDLMFGKGYALDRMDMAGLGESSTDK